jgi:hypothetical protein
VQGSSSIAIGQNCARYSQALLGIAIGYEAQNQNSLERSIAIGVQSGMFSQGTYCTAVGYQAGHISQGNNSTALGWLAGRNNQHARSLILNGSGATLDSDRTDATFIKPIRNEAHSKDTRVLAYIPGTGEVIYKSPTSSFNFIDNWSGSWNGNAFMPQTFTLTKTCNVKWDGYCTFFSSSVANHWVDFSIYTSFFGPAITTYRSQYWFNETYSHKAVPINKVFSNVPAGTYQFYGVCTGVTDGNDVVNIVCTLLYD